jgi:hypothetical protein
MVTKIHGQPTSQDLTIPEKEIIVILANIPPAFGGGNYGHIGIIMEPTGSSAMSGGINFANSLNQGFYPATLAATAAAGTRAKAEAEHNEHYQPIRDFRSSPFRNKRPNLRISAEQIPHQN